MGKIVKSPRISINKLADYTDANSSRRKKIIEECKYPDDVRFLQTWYNDAKKYVAKYCTTGFDVDILDKGMKTIAAKPALDPTSVTRNKSNAEVLALLKSIEFPDLSNFNVYVYKGENKKLEIKGVDISAYPDIIIEGVHRKNPIVGALKFQYSSGNQLTEEPRKSVSALLVKFLQDEYPKHKAHLPLCLSIDIHQQGITAAPKTIISRFNQIDACCEEIADRWDSI
ncbi:hypothetical protein [uncultured Imperialibacter sp.]|uniref:hypothetical protein n=1 Tax=uncultured Imperialibacter sp. TaxID=1672639 RepID=UPI0030D8D76C|tara:strand:+ start:69351 stop:70031 length:681 start_codon:yes stop_codon:yes gene_type:complete